MRTKKYLFLKGKRSALAEASHCFNTNQVGTKTTQQNLRRSSSFIKGIIKKS